MPQNEDRGGKSGEVDPAETYSSKKEVHESRSVLVAIVTWTSCFLVLHY